MACLAARESEKCILHLDCHGLLWAVPQLRRAALAEVQWLSEMGTESWSGHSDRQYLFQNAPLGCPRLAGIATIFSANFVFSSSVTNIGSCSQQTLCTPNSVSATTTRDPNLLVSMILPVFNLQNIPHIATRGVPWKYYSNHVTSFLWALWEASHIVLLSETHVLSMDNMPHKICLTWLFPLCLISNLTHSLLISLQPYQPLPWACSPPSRPGLLSLVLPQGLMGLTPSSLCSNDTSSEKPALIVLFKISRPSTDLHSF